MKKLLMLTVLTLSLICCEKEDTDNLVSVQAKVLGEWEVYKFEKQELILDFEDGEMVQSMEWRDLSPSAEPEP